MAEQLHPDWPEFDASSAKSTWELPTPVDDLAYALSCSGAPMVAGRLGETTDTIALADVASVARYYVEYHQTQWRPGDEGGSELQMAVVGQLRDGRWFSVNAWNDYTGWGCQDDAQVRVADDWSTIWSQGLDDEGRRYLTVTVDADPTRPELGAGDQR